MNKENKNNYYNDEDEIIFEKLGNFKKFNSNIQNNTQYKNIKARSLNMYTRKTTQYNPI